MGCCGGNGQRSKQQSKSAKKSSSSQATGIQMAGHVAVSSPRPSDKSLNQYFHLLQKVR